MAMQLLHQHGEAAGVNGLHLQLRDSSYAYGSSSSYCRCCCCCCRRATHRRSWKLCEAGLRGSLLQAATAKYPSQDLYILGTLEVSASCPASAGILLLPLLLLQLCLCVKRKIARPLCPSPGGIVSRGFVPGLLVPTPQRSSSVSEGPPGRRKLRSSRGITVLR